MICIFGKREITFNTKFVKLLRKSTREILKFYCKRTLYALIANRYIANLHFVYAIFVSVRLHVYSRFLTSLVWKIFCSVNLASVLFCQSISIRIWVSICFGFVFIDLSVLIIIFEFLKEIYFIKRHLLIIFREAVHLKQQALFCPLIAMRFVI